MKRARRNRRKAAKRELPKLPPLPRLNINWRAWGATVAVLGVVAVSAMLGRDFVDLPVRKLEIEASFQRVSKLELEAAVQSAVEDQSFLSLDMNAIRDHVAAIAWVDTVLLQRVWPDTLKISISEHRAAARWGESGLLNTRGELFVENMRQEYRELPLLQGPAGSHRRVAMRYLEIRERLARAGLALDSLRMDARGAFTIELVGGLSVRIGRDDIAGRIDRFFAVAVPQLAVSLERIAYFDMRYPNGFAVGWREGEAASTQLARLENGG